MVLSRFYQSRCTVSHNVVVLLWSWHLITFSFVWSRWVNVTYRSDYNYAICRIWKVLCCKSGFGLGAMNTNKQKWTNLTQQSTWCLQKSLCNANSIRGAQVVLQKNCFSLVNCWDTRCKKVCKSSFWYHLFSPSLPKEHVIFPG